MKKYLNLSLVVLLTSSVLNASQNTRFQKPPLDLTLQRILDGGYNHHTLTKLSALLKKYPASLRNMTITTGEFVYVPTLNTTVLNLEQHTPISYFITKLGEDKRTNALLCFEPETAPENTNAIKTINLLKKNGYLLTSNDQTALSKTNMYVLQGVSK